MTSNQLTRERLEKIKSWREIYGAGSNVMLPAEEAEELARIALAAMDSEPVAWTDKEELSDLKRDGYAAMLSLARQIASTPIPDVRFCYSHIQRQRVNATRYAVSTLSGHRRPSVMSARLAR